MKNKLLSLLVVVLACLPVAQAQNSSNSAGTSFGVAFLYMNSSYDYNYLSFLADTACMVWISNPNTNWSDSVSIAANTEYRYTLPGTTVSQSLSGAVGNYGVLVNSSKPIHLYAYKKCASPCSLDGTLVLPAADLDCQYVVNTYPVGYATSYAYNDRCGFVVMAVPDKRASVSSTDTTVVDIYLTDTASSITTDSSHVVVRLLPGQTYHVYSPVHNGDFSGTLVQSRGGRKIAVFSGNKTAHIPATAPGGDHLYTQLFPTRTWGKEFFVMPSKENDTSYVRVTALFDGCQVHRNGTLAGTLGQYQTLQFVITQATRIVTSQPVEVLTCLPSRSCTAGDCQWGDAAFSVVPPMMQGVTSTRFPSYNMDSRNGNQTHYYVDVVTATADSAQLSLDGNTVTGFSTSQGYAYKRITLPSFGCHRLAASGTATFVANAYATDENWGGYILSTGGRAQTIVSMDSVVRLVCNGHPIAGDTLSTCHADPLSLSVNMDCDSVVWDMGDGHTVCANPLNYHYASPGHYHATARAYLQYPYSWIANYATRHFVVEVLPQDTLLTVMGTCEGYQIYEGSVFTRDTDIVLGYRPNPDGCDTVELLRILFYPSYDTTVSVVAQQGTDYTWIDGNVYSHDNNSATYLLSTIHGCDSLIRLNLTFSDIGIGSASSSLAIAPNPTSGLLTLSSSDPMTLVELFDLAGKQLMRLSQSATLLDMDLSAFPAGTYFLKATTPKGISVKKIVRR